jgi:light-regulated signal transduction histidine kinase (bacteriophytochrome)
MEIISAAGNPREGFFKSGKGLFSISVAAGILSWVLNAFFERFVFDASGNTFFDHLVNIPPEEFFDRVITFLVFLVFGLVVSGLYEKRHAAEERLATLAAELQRRNRALEQFASVASHDLKEPLVTVGGFLARLKRRCAGELDAEANRNILHALESVERMERLIVDLLEFSRATTQARPFQAIDASAVLDTALGNLAETLRSKGVVVTRDPLPGIFADSTQMGQLFQNLVSNAVKYCRKETPRVHISAARKGGELAFSVRDNGIGIAPEHTEVIFTAFRRLHDGDEFPGTGLGLATCAKIVERHHGRIWVESNPGEGSTFYFTVPEKEPGPVRR